MSALTICWAVTVLRGHLTQRPRSCLGPEIIPTRVCTPKHWSPPYSWKTPEMDVSSPYFWSSRVPGWILSLDGPQGTKEIQSPLSMMFGYIKASTIS